MDEAKMALAQALILLGIGFAAVAQCVRKMDGSMPSRQAIREIAMTGFRALRGKLGRPTGTKILNKTDLAVIKSLMIKLRDPKGNAIGYRAVYNKLPANMRKRASYYTVRKALLQMGYKYLERPRQDDPNAVHKNLRNTFANKHAKKNSSYWCRFLQAVGDITTVTYSPPSIAHLSHRHATKKTLMKTSEKSKFSRPRNGLTKEQRKKQQKFKLLVFLSPAENGTCLVLPLPMPYTAPDVGKLIEKRVAPWLTKLYPDKSQLLASQL